MYEVVSMSLRKISVIALALTVLTACGGGDSNSAPAFSHTELAFTLGEDTKLTAQAEATDADGDTLTYMLESAANNGVFQLLQNGNFSYSPFADFHGTDHVRLSVSDGKDKAVVDLTFTIHNVNDIPKILSSNVIVNSSGITTGKIEAFDQDGDVLTFSLVSSPENGTLEIDSSTGEFVYTPEVLSMIDGSFLVAVTDGIIETPVPQRIELRPSYITNADKLNYYYSSNSSHLKKSEYVIAQLPDDNAKDTANTELASGYLIAGFQSKAEEILGNAITEAGAQALAYRNASTHADAIGNTGTGTPIKALFIV
ncbi:MAG: cadherin-like domain-containing protein [Pararheinheimera sp.]|nr:cadherin-like domain-containing protein [Rheinheimera sp.]